MNILFMNKFDYVLLLHFLVVVFQVDIQKIYVEIQFHHVMVTVVLF